VVVSRTRSTTAAIAAALLVAAAACGGGDDRPAKALKPPTTRATSTTTGATTSTRTTPKVVSRTFISTGDAYVRQDEPTTTFGNTAELRIDASPSARAYIRFQPVGVQGKIEAATLRVYALTTSGNGFEIHGTTANWSEAGITFANAPPPGASIGPSGPLIAGSWVMVDVSSLVSSATSSVNVVLTGSGSTSLALASREQHQRAPRLIITSTP